jgi:serine/threonine-protein kinase
MNPLPDDETLLLKAATRNGWISAEHVVEARALQDKLVELGLRPKPMGEILMERGFITDIQKKELEQTVAKVKAAFRIPGYQLLEKLGGGSTGTVYRARQLGLDRIVALKVLAKWLCDDEGYVRRFIKEARLAGRMNHPHIVQGFDAGEAQGLWYFAMEYCPGPTLLSLLNRGGAMDETRVVSIMRQIAMALGHAHELGLVHRDVKPDNIVIAEGGIAKLLDLGLAKDVRRKSGSTERGSTLGTPNYISPEQAKGLEDIDGRSDFYSLGATFYHALTGQPPFDGPNPTVIMLKHVSENPVPLSKLVPAVHPDTERIVLRMLAKNPLDRYQTAQALLADIDNIGSGPTQRRQNSRRITSWRRRG